MGMLTMSEIVPGMKLAKQVNNFQGVMLLPGGMVLTDRHIRLMKSWGITGVEIEGAERQTADSIDLLSLSDRKKIKDHLMHRFPYDELDPVNEELRRVAFMLMIRNFRKEAGNVHES
jgi:hypothetical protein